LREPCRFFKRLLGCDRTASLEQHSAECDRRSRRSSERASSGEATHHVAQQTLGSGMASNPIEVDRPSFALD
jgi:hypothetical protein